MRRIGVLGAAACLLVSTGIGQVWEPAGILPTSSAPRIYGAGVNVDGTIYAIGGAPWQNGNDRDGVVHRLQGGVWSATAPIDGVGPVISGASGVDNIGRIVIYGGFILDNGGPGDEKVYDPIEGAQASLAPRDVPEEAVGYFAWARDADGLLYGFGGGPGGGGPNSGYCDRYSGAADVWTTLAAMPTGAADACAAYDGAGHMLVIGGINAAGSARLANVARYDILTNSWSDTAVPDLPVALSGARAILGADGRIYVIGGESGPLGAGVTQATTYKLDLAANEWSVGPSLQTPRKWFACALGSDDHIYAIGGDNDSGGTNTAEKLFTPACPTFAQQPQPLAAWSGSIAGFSTEVRGAAPFAYAWRLDGTFLEDGPTGTGSVIRGSTTASLVIERPGSADTGSYDVVVTNDCGASTSASAELTVREPPAPPAGWEVTAIHPAWAAGASSANGISDGRIGGSATTPTMLPDGRVLDIAHPVLWDASTLIEVDITPPGSIGGSVLDVEGDLAVGWFWHIYSCPPWTCGWESAGYWSGQPPVFTEVHISGAEYDHVNATDGARMVGTATFEYSQGNYTSKAYLWSRPNIQHSLHPASVASDSGANAMDGEFQYGSIVTTARQVHAAMWSGTAESMVDMHPIGYARSWISGAGDGQVVGSAYLGSASRAMLWVGSAVAFVDLGGGSAVAADGGVQIGSGPGGGGLWFGTPESYVSLNDYLPPGFTPGSAVVRNVRVSPEGAITIVGAGFNAPADRSEALIWRSTGCDACDANCDGAVDAFDIEPFIDLLVNPNPTPCAPCTGDVNGDGTIDAFDIEPFINCLVGP